MVITKTLRLVALCNHALVWVSSLIVTGIVSYFLNAYSRRGGHIVYQEVIAVITLGFWTIGMFLPLLHSYRGHLLPLNLVFSYLWLTSFIFSALDWSGHRCPLVGPGYGHCSLKRAVTAFNFVAFFFLLCNIIVEGFLLRTDPQDGNHDGSNKVRRGTATTTDTTAPANDV